ncbi:hypothetical protein BGW38_001649 [Lunasporangiospora selenospora]|uniref:Inhibitor I9 domain-containing protein n=1 Tax=Lunasporangiospora selenospora TaxID=979761 RepID=A0A9P6KHW2_9FUNG|nr:hypothetical protein BGW38_001649 [Lunasporangiospora selenospora]
MTAHSQNPIGANDLSNALSASVMPVGVNNPGGATASTLGLPQGEADANKVLVIFKEDTPPSEIENAIRNVESQGGRITQRYTSVMLGFAAQLPDNTVQSMASNPHVDYIEPDGQVSIYTQELLKSKN